jgi:exopolysaccharide biosynthesis polyprenyl glycosylphosphotransferase
LLPLLDVLCLLGIAAATDFVCVLCTALSGPAGAGLGLGRAAIIVAPFMLYDPGFGAAARRRKVGALVGSHALRFALFTAAMLGLGLLGGTLRDVPVAVLEFWFVGSLLLTSMTRALVARYVFSLRRDGALAEVIAVVGSGPVADRLARTIAARDPATATLIGPFDDAPSPTGVAPVAGTIADLIALAGTRRIDWILLASPPFTEPDLPALVSRLERLSVPIGLCPPSVGAGQALCGLDFVAGSIPVSILADRPINRHGALQKACADKVLGSAITLLLLPVLLAVAAAIKLTSPGPVFFRQKRHALDNREFEILKFRTMRWAPPKPTDTLVQTSRTDARITPLGRLLRATSVDELPQLLNVLKGEMSLVGPRPHAIDMRTESRLGVEITDVYPHRHRVKPGMTGWSQVNGARGATETEAQLLRRVELDLYYIDNWSILLDLKILLLTTREVLRRTNAF